MTIYFSNSLRVLVSLILSDCLMGMCSRVNSVQVKCSKTGSNDTVIHNFFFILRVSGVGDNASCQLNSCFSHSCLISLSQTDFLN